MNGSYASQFCVNNGSPGLLGDAQGETVSPIPTLRGRNRKGTRYSWIHPNLTFAASAETAWTYDVLPVSPQSSRVGMTVCFHPNALNSGDFEQRARRYYERMDAALAEDLPMPERQQRRFTSPYASPGRFSWLEPSVASFAAWYARATGAGQT